MFNDAPCPLFTSHRASIMLALMMRARYILVDDLRPSLSPYGQTQVHTPNIAKLAAGAMTFLRAYCQEAVCSPSRNSFLSGRRPDHTRAWNFVSSPRCPQGPRDPGSLATLTACFQRVPHTSLICRRSITSARLTPAWSSPILPSMQHPSPQSVSTCRRAARASVDRSAPHVPSASRGATARQAATARSFPRRWIASTAP
jgi:hypothetical protein